MQSGAVGDFALVTGGAGFVGKALVRALLEQGTKVRVLDLDDPHDDDIKISDIEFVKGSITNPATAKAACHNITIVYHLAGNAQLWSKDPTQFDVINHIGTQTIFQAAREQNVKTFLHCSSLTTLVGKDTIIGHSNADETTQLPYEAMLGPYPKSKWRAEKFVLDNAPSDMRAMVAIPTEPLGAGDVNVTPPTQMILDFVNGKTPASIECLLNFVPVDDLARGLIAMNDRGKTNERYILGGENVPMATLLETLSRITETPMPKLQLPYWVALTAGFFDTKLVSSITQKPPKAPLTGVRLAGRKVAFQSDKARIDLGWQASPFDGALKEMLNWARTQGHIKKTP